MIMSDNNIFLALIIGIFELLLFLAFFFVIQINKLEKRVRILESKKQFPGPEKE